MIAINPKDMEVEIGNLKHISIYRERPATPSEKRKDPDATVMTEWVRVEFSTKRPKIVINRVLCGD